MKLPGLLLLFFPLFAQATHSVTLNWVDTANPMGTTYNVYRSTSTCSAPAFTILQSGVSAKTFLDATVSPGNYCYRVTAVLNGIESAPSSSVPAPVPPFVPSGLSVIVL